VPHLFKLPTALLEYLNLLRGAAAPCPSGLLQLYIKMIEIYNIGAQPYEPMHTALKQSHCVPHLRIFGLPVMFNQLCSSMNQQLFKKNFCNQSSHYRQYP